jgi:hypothetical protein
MGTIAVGERNKMLDAYVGRATYTASAAFYVQLHTGAPGAAGTSNVAGETTRKLVTFGDAAASGAIANTAIIEWTNVSTSETYSHVSYWTASSGGTFLGEDDLSSTAVMVAGQTFNIPVGDLDLTLTGAIAEGERNKMLDALVGRTTYTAQAAFYVKLHTGDPGAAGTNNAAGETTRQAPTFGDAAASGAITPTANTDWASYSTGETVSHVSLWSHVSAGTWLGNDQLAAGVAMGAGETFRIPTGELDLTLS